MKMLIDATHAEETRVVVIDGTKVEEFDFEAASRRQLAGNIYLAKITRVEPSLQAAFVDYGGNRHGFLAFSEIHPDYYQIPMADRKALIEEERAYAKQQEDEEQRGPRRSRRNEGAAKPAAADSGNAVKSADVPASIPGMDVVDLDTDGDDAPESEHQHTADDNGDDDAPYAAVDHAADNDDQIESVADEDVSDEVRPERKPRGRRYKIQEVVKVRQIMLVQVVKEERGNKGAALTTYLSLAGRYCVLMPNTARGGGISRKITNAVDRKKLKEIAQEIEVPDGAGLIVRTAGAQRTKAEIKRDYEYLMRMWEQIRDLTLKSIAPAPIYEEGDLIKRSIRDLYSKEIDEVLVEGEVGYRTAKDFMKMIMPSHAKNVKHYTDPMPLFARHQVESYLGGMFNPTVQLRSGGYIVIGITEALVAIDVNSGRATKEGSIEETATKTNLEAAEEIARQLRLRDLAGLIVIDFIDMEDRRNNAAVEKKLKDKLKTDRARIQVGRISGFGLMEMSRQRLRPGMLEATTQPCSHCHGTGLLRSDDSQALAILRQIEEEGTRKRSREVLVRAPVGIINFLINQKREHIALIELRYGMAVRLEADPALVSPDSVIEKFKTATRPVPEAMPVVSGNATLMSDIEADDIADEDEIDEDEAPEASTGDVAEVEVKAGNDASADAPGDDGGRRKRRRRRRRRGGANDGNGADQLSGADGDDDEDGEAAETAPESAPEADAPTTRRRVTRGGRSRRKADAPVEDKAADLTTADAATEATAEATAEAPAEATAETPAKPKRRRSRKAPAADAATAEAASAEAPTAEAASDVAAPEADAAPAEKPKPKRTRTRKPAKDAAPAQEAEAAPVAQATSEPATQAAPEPVTQATPEPVAEPAPETVQESAQPKADAEPQPEADAGLLVQAAPEAEPDTQSASEPEQQPEPAPDAPRKRGWWSSSKS